MNKKRNITLKCTAVLVGLIVLNSATIVEKTWAKSASDVIEKFIKVTGGRKAHEKVKSAIEKAELTIPAFGIRSEVTTYYKGGNYKFVTNMASFGELVQGVNGDVAWSKDPAEGYKLLKGNEAEAMLVQASLNPLLDWQEKFTSAEITGSEGGKTKIRFSTASGYQMTCTFDNKSGFMTAQESPGADGAPTDITFSDYKKVKRIRLPHKLTIQTAQAAIDMVTTSVKLNAKIEDSVFELPSEIQTLISQAQAAPPAGGYTAEQLMSYMDTNGDGKITLEEAPAEMKGGFQYIDTNGDGGIDVKEAQIMVDYTKNAQ